MTNLVHKALPHDSDSNSFFQQPAWSWLRMAVLGRDNFKCQNCGCGPGSGRFLQAHHIKHRGIFPEFAYDLTNLTTLCNDCHQMMHSHKINNWNPRKDSGAKLRPEGAKLRLEPSLSVGSLSKTAPNNLRR